MMNEENEEQDIYSEEGVENFMEDDEITDIEQGFMVGYLGV